VFNRGETLADAEGGFHPGDRLDGDRPAGHEVLTAVYVGVLTVHSWLRWATLALAIGATLNAGLRRDADVSAGMPGRHWDTYFMLALDLQVLFGLALYFGLSPYTAQAFANFGAAMRNPALRFWAIQHIGTMAAAVLLVRLGRVLALTAKSGAARRRRRLIFFALTTLTIIFGIPWPGLQSGRPLIRMP